MEPSVRSDYDDRPAAASEEGRSHGAEAVKRSSQVCRDHFRPVVLMLSKKKLTPSNSGITDKQRRHRDMPVGSFHHLMHRMRLANIGLVKHPGSTGGHHSGECVIGRWLVLMIMDPDRPGGRCKSEADGSANPS